MRSKVVITYCMLFLFAFTFAAALSMEANAEPEPVFCCVAFCDDEWTEVSHLGWMDRNGECQPTYNPAGDCPYIVYTCSSSQP